MRVSWACILTCMASRAHTPIMQAPTWICRKRLANTSSLVQHTRQQQQQVAHKPRGHSSHSSTEHLMILQAVTPRCVRLSQRGTHLCSCREWWSPQRWSSHQRHTWYSWQQGPGAPCTRPWGRGQPGRVPSGSTQQAPLQDAAGSRDHSHR
jgi:hypothetical protein